MVKGFDDVKLNDLKEKLFRVKWTRLEHEAQRSTLMGNLENFKYVCKNNIMKEKTKRGIKKGDPVGLLLDNLADLLVNDFTKSQLEWIVQKTNLETKAFKNYLEVLIKLKEKMRKRKKCPGEKDPRSIDELMEKLKEEEKKEAKEKERTRQLETQLKEKEKNCNTRTIAVRKTLDEIKAGKRKMKKLVSDLDKAKDRMNVVFKVLDEQVQTVSEESEKMKRKVQEELQALGKYDVNLKCLKLLHPEIILTFGTINYNLRK